MWNDINTKNSGGHASLQAYAIAMLDHGLCVMPPMDDGTKRPFAKWKEYQNRLPTDKEVRTWYSNGKASIGVVTGQVSGGFDGGLECLDFDDRAIYDQFVQRSAGAGLGPLVDRICSGYSEQSPNGVHILYYCSEVGGNTKLANRAADKKATIETRGEGGFVVIAPTIWPGKEYRITSGGITAIATITPAERAELFRLAKTFDEAPATLPLPKTVPTAANVSGDRPGDDYCRKASWDDILIPHGWRRCFSVGNVTHWGRPGKPFGVSATTNHADSDLLYVFSSSTCFTPERGYNKFGAYAILNHHGDFEQAGQELRRQGYGSEPTIELPRWTQETPQPATDDTAPEIKTFSWVATASFAPIRWIVQDLIPEGCTILAGAPKIGKSWLATELCLCAASNGKRPFLGKFTLDHIGVLYLALEDSDRRLNDRINKLVHQVPAWSEHFVAAPMAVHYHTAFPTLDKGCIPKLTDHLDRHPHCKLVIVDTLQKIRPPAGKNMTAYEMDYEVISAFQQLAIHRHIAIILLHHLRKSSGITNEDPFEQVSGSMGISGAADSTIVFHKGKSSDLAELYVRGRDVEEQTISLRMDDGCWQYLGTGMESEGRKYLTEIKEFAQERKIVYFKPSDFNRWYRENTGAEIKNIRKTFQRLFEGGQLMKWDAGKYSLPGVKDKAGGKD